MEGSLVERLKFLHAKKWKEANRRKESKWRLSTTFVAKGLKYIVKK